MDKILIKDLFLRCTIGVSPEERRDKVDVLINVILFVDVKKAGKSDRIEDTVNYRDVNKRIISIVEHSQYTLAEALAERIASLCLDFPGVMEARVLVEKPSALRFARNVGVEITRKASDVKAVQAFVALGSNINPLENIPQALELLEKRMSVIQASTFYETEPLGNRGDPPFVNGLIEIGTKLSPESLKHFVLRPIEEMLGRKRSADRNAPRTIDLDLTLYGDLVVKQDDLIVPDPQITERNFLAIPLAELAPELIPPGWDKSLRECADKMNHHGMKPLYEFTEDIKRQISNYSVPKEGYNGVNRN